MELNANKTATDISTSEQPAIASIITPAHHPKSTKISKFKLCYQKNIYQYVFHDYSLLRLLSLFDVYTTRFDSNTYLELYHKKTRLEWTRPQPQAQTQQLLQPGSLYGVSASLPESITKYTYIFVLEMNNTINKIVGIGLIKNSLASDADISKIGEIYDGEKNSKFNKFVYKSNYHIQLIDPEGRITSYAKSKIKDPNNIELRYSSCIYLENIPPEFIKLLENEIEPACFFGKGHLKRGGGFTHFPFNKISKKTIFMFITLFDLLNPNNFRENIMHKFKNS